ncbi:uracil-DNA glycosylase [candidate division KSB1 bacterium]|nr:uracil-DNA glycosylase [candidate division KSB1 bacterium]
MTIDIDNILELLKANKSTHVFNPWWESDPEHDLDGNSPRVRREQLSQYLRERQGAKVLLVGEGLSYRGGHFTGIAMTSERILLGRMRHRGIMPEHVFSGIESRRTSNPAVRENGFSENTATIVWDFLTGAGYNTRDFLFWNAFPWHPYDKTKGLLSNRPPSPSELELGRPVLKTLLGAFRFERIFAVGAHAKTQLDKMGLPSIKVRHPAYGGASEFKKQMNLMLTQF